MPPVSPQGQQEVLLDFEDIDAAEHEATPQPADAAEAEGAPDAMDADEAAADADPTPLAAGKRAAEEMQQQSEEVAAAAGAPQDDEQQAAKRSKRAAIPRPDLALSARKPAAGSAAGADAGSPAPAATPVAAAGDGAAAAADAPASAVGGAGSERKRKHAPIPVPPARSSSGASRELPRQASSGSAAAGAAAPAEPTPDQEQTIAAAVAAAGDLPAEATAALRITGLKRPLQPAALKQKLSETGFVVGMQLTKMKDKAWVLFREPGHAHATRHALQGVDWPEGNKSRLALQFMPAEVAQYAIEHEASVGKEQAGGSEAVEAAGGDAAAANGSTPTAAAADGAELGVKAGGVLTLDDLFRKTTTKPQLYYLPLTDEQVAVKKQRQSKADSGAVSGGVGKPEPLGPSVMEGLAPHHSNKH
ncbi:hypothetical protein COO60DRAFT_1531565 [Scenedesmus sp. NREL 46B-D3]|nr:hypothetical protein COO60DRAFT_1531565 [Scenedesmus sp. NREL 46B-D3]